jgi:hypothetical protein
MQVATVTTSDNSLLHAVRQALTGADEAFLCVAFVQERGLHLLERELDALRKRQVRTRMLVTTTFATTTTGALALAHNLGVDVYVLNPGGGTFHPKLYLGRAGAEGRAVIGSANLTGGLATNVEAAVSLTGPRDAAPLVEAWGWAESLWADPRTAPWKATGVASPGEEAFADDLYPLLDAAIRRDPVFLTLGRSPAVNMVTSHTRTCVNVATARSPIAQPIPAWMFNLAWERLKTHGRLSNRELLDELRVMRSSAVCAMLARLPPVHPLPGPSIVLGWS